MATPRDGPNPLRPYYIPPSIGIPQDVPTSTNSGTHGLGPRNGSAASYASSAREMFSDIDYSEYLSETSPSSAQSVQRWVNEALHKYMSILLSQPFDVAKMVLQVRSLENGDSTAPSTPTNNVKRSSSYRDNRYDDHSDDSDQDELTYFTSNAPSAQSYPPSRSRRRHSDTRSPSPVPTPTENSKYQLTIKGNALMDVISQEWTKEGAWGVWKCSNATWMYLFLNKSLEGFSRAFLSAILNIPDPGALGAASDLLDTNYPWASLGLAVAAAALTGLILAPLDLVRTKLMLTPVSGSQRAFIHNVRTLPSYVCSPLILAPTVLHSIVPPIFSHSTPLVLRSQFGIDPVMTPGYYSFAKLLSRGVELFVRLPLETVLRRGQMAVAASPMYAAEDGRRLETTVEIGPYNGVVGTMWSIAREEGTSSEPVLAKPGAKAAKKSKKSERKGQGIEGLWRGWRVGAWGLVGLWAANALGAGASGAGAGEF